MTLPEIGSMAQDHTMERTSRRNFMKQAAAVAVATPALRGLPLWGAVIAPTGVHGWITDGDRRFSPIDVPAWKESSEASQAEIKIDRGRSFQSILGFGGAFTDASCYLFNKMDAPERRKLLAELVGPDGLRMSVGRTCIGASDYSRTVYSFDDGGEPDPELKRFSIAHDRDYILPVLRAAQDANPDLYLFSAPWSPPGWMKAGGSMLGGSMRNHYFDAYAQYFVKFLQAYQAEGVKIRAVTTQNEVDTDQDGRMPASLWGQEYESGFIKEHLGPAFQRAGLDTKIWLLDHNYDLWGRVMDQLSDPEVFKYVEGVAWHGYMGAPNAMTRIHDAFPSKQMYWTEGGPDFRAPDYATDWAKWSSTFAGILKNWARCIVSWNLLLDEKGTPNIGPFDCGGVVTIDSKTGKLTRSGQYWAFAHYSKVIQRDARVIASDGTVPHVDCVALMNPDGSYVLVATNQGEERQVSCSFENKVMNLNLPHNSVTTVVWS
jgi:glucosylceramidase